MKRRSLDGDIWLKLDAFRPFDPLGVHQLRPHQRYSNTVEIFGE